MTTLMEVERLAFELPEKQRATLAAHILESLPVLFSDSDEGIAEASRRDEAMDNNVSARIELAQFEKMVAERKRL